MTEKDDQLTLHLDELNMKSAHPLAKDLESKGFLPGVRLEDFTIRDHTVYLLVRRRKWVNKQTGEIVTNTYDLSAKGSSYTEEFGSFLKTVVGHYSG